MEINAETAIEGLTFLICGETSHHPFADLGGLSNSVASWHRLSPIQFDGFEPLWCGGEDDFDENDPITYIMPGRNPADQPIWPLDVSVAVRHNNLDEWQDGVWWFQRIHTLKQAEWRGRLLRHLPRMVEHKTLVVEPNGRAESARFPYGLTKTGVVKLPTSLESLSYCGLPGSMVMSPSYFGRRHKVMSRNRSGEYDPEPIVKITAGIALRHHYCWSVMLGEGNGPRARFLTDPIGIREAFRLRDIPPGAQRRRALLHWVKAHWRKRRSVSAADRAWVDAYLRGAWSFTWNGLRGQIVPPKDDLDHLVERGAA